MKTGERKFVLLVLTIFLIGSFLFLYGKNKLEEKRIIEKEKQKVAQEKLNNKKALEDAFQKIIISIKENTDFNIKEITPPPPPSISRMKIQGCIADGMLNVQNQDAKDALGLINRSNCYYLHRAVETWLEAPDFEKIKESMNKITKEDIVYGMFIAEAIDTKADYFSKTKDRDLKFSKMCKNGTKNFWGEHTCIPYLKEEEYQNYVFDIAIRAIDLGIQVFMFGQIHYQDNIERAYVEELLDKIRDYAKFRGLEIVIGAQTNDIKREQYLRMFDFIEGGVGINENGEVEEGPCFSRWWKKKGDWCWALLWHKDFKEKANNVFVHLDWSGKIGDDMSIFARMSGEKRAETLERLHKKFTSMDVGFILPMLAVLPKDNGGCHGESRKFYSASNQYSCKDEDVINKFLSKQKYE